METRLTLESLYIRCKVTDTLLSFFSIIFFTFQVTPGDTQHRISPAQIIVTDTQALTADFPTQQREKIKLTFMSWTDEFSVS